VAAILLSGPFDPLLCRLTTRQFGCPPILVNGTVEKGYEPIMEAFKKQFEEGQSRGLQLSIWKDVVDPLGRTEEIRYFITNRQDGC